MLGITQQPGKSVSESVAGKAGVRLLVFDNGVGGRCRCGRGVRGRLDNVWCGVPLRRSADACQGERDVLKSV